MLYLICYKLEDFKAGMSFIFATAFLRTLKVLILENFYIPSFSFMCRNKP